MPADIITPPRTMLEVYESLPEGTPVQLIQNKLMMSPAPFTDHQNTLFEIAFQINKFLKKKESGKIFIAPYDVHLDEQNVFQPDILFVAKENLHKIRENGFYGAPDLVIEILSPSTSHFDRTEKSEMYEQHGVQEYWIIDPKTKIAEGFWLQHGKFETIPQEEDRGKIPLKLLKLNISF